MRLKYKISDLQASPLKAAITAAFFIRNNRRLSIAHLSSLSGGR